MSLAKWGNKKRQGTDRNFLDFNVAIKSKTYPCETNHRNIKIYSQI